MSVRAPTLYLAEPPSQYLLKPPVVIDCSVVAALVFREEGETEALARMLGRTLHAPHLLAIEMTSVARKKMQSGQIELAKQALAQFETADILFHTVGLQSMLELATAYDLSAYDSAYLSLATSLKCPLLTFDAKLAKAAATHLSSLD